MGKIKEIISHSVLNYVQLKTKKTRKHNPRITRDIIHAKRKVKRLRKSVKAKPTPRIRDTLSEAISNMKSLIKTAKANYYCEAVYV